MKFVYIGRVSCYMTDAASIRVHNVGAALKEEGHQVDFICQEGLVPDGEITIDGSRYYGVFDSKTSKISKGLEWLFGSKAVKCLRTLIKNEKYDGIILYNAPVTTAKKVLKLCRQNRISLFNDVTEWYEISLNKGFFAYVNATLIDRRIRKLDYKSDGVIAISPYFENYYAKRTAVVNLPPVFESYGQPNTSKNEVPKFLYAGSPSRKDELFNFVEAVKEINRENIRVELNIVGAPIPNDSEELASKGIIYSERMPHEEILKLLRKHDFSILLRREARYAKAGYSTKIAEALYNGTPVFCNEIGGADVDVIDGFNGIKIPVADKVTIINSLERIINMPKEELSQMKNNAFAFGKEKYSRESYKKTLCSFMTDSVMKSKSL